MCATYRETSKYQNPSGTPSRGPDAILKKADIFRPQHSNKNRAASRTLRRTAIPRKGYIYIYTYICRRVRRQACYVARHDVLAVFKTNTNNRIYSYREKQSIYTQQYII